MRSGLSREVTQLGQDSTRVSNPSKYTKIIPPFQCVCSFLKMGDSREFIMYMRAGEPAARPYKRLKD